MNESIQVNMTIDMDIPLKLIASAICTAMENGSGYWARVTEDSGIPEGTLNEDFLGEYYYKYFNGGWTEFGTVNDQTGEIEAGRYRLDLDSIKSGLKIMAEQWTHHYKDLINMSGDSITADVFLQCCLLKDIVYG